ncbi:putative Trypanosome variant surface glycoprotein (A type) [Trypanosoma vivax]|nr:putative Trypanosome variant surface glycoprotein (A type) [Trypanosoma vivax]
MSAALGPAWTPAETEWRAADTGPRTQGRFSFLLVFFAGEMRERSATCAFLAACVLLALLGLRAHAAGKEPMEVNGAKLFCDLSGTLKKVAKEIAAQLTARQGEVPKLSAVSLLLAQQALAQAPGTGVANDTIRSLRARLEDVTGAQGKAQQMATLARDIEREARARADEIDSLVHLFARTRGAKNYGIKAEDSTSKAQLYDIDAQQGWVAPAITDAAPHGNGATLTTTGVAKLKGCARRNTELAIEGAGNTSLFAQIQALTVDLAATQSTTEIFKKTAEVTRAQAEVAVAQCAAARSPTALPESRRKTTE